ETAQVRSNKDGEVEGLVQDSVSQHGLRKELAADQQHDRRDQYSHPVGHQPGAYCFAHAYLTGQEGPTRPPPPTRIERQSDRPVQRRSSRVNSHWTTWATGRFPASQAKQLPGQRLDQPSENDLPATRSLHHDTRGDGLSSTARLLLSQLSEYHAWPRLGRLG